MTQKVPSSPLVLKASQVVLALDYFKFADRARNHTSTMDTRFYPVPAKANPHNFDVTKAKETLLRFGITYTNRFRELTIACHTRALIARALDAKVDFPVDVAPIIDEMVDCNWIYEFVYRDYGPISNRADRSDPKSYVNALTRFFAAIGANELTERDLQ